jgi:hypothetical protein
MSDIELVSALAELTGNGGLFGVMLWLIYSERKRYDILLAFILKNGGNTLVDETI